MISLGTILEIAALLLYLAAVLTLARADGWSNGKAVLLVAGMALLPFFALWGAYQPAMPVFIGEGFKGIVGVGVALVLFALAKSVSNKVSSHD